MSGLPRRVGGGWGWSVGAGVLYFAVVAALAPIGDRVRLNPDEGNNLMKARLIEQGYELYEEIWSDQPPGLAYALAWWEKLFGESVAAGRILVLLHASMLVGLLFELIRRSVGVWGAAGGVLLLVVLGGYVRLSVSVMIGVPALAWALASIWLVRTGGGRWGMPALSGAAMAVSLSMKLFTGLLVPWLVLEAYRVQGERGRWKRGLAGSGMWLAGFGLSAAALVWSSGATAWDQLLGTHVRAWQVDQYDGLFGLWVLSEWGVNNPGLVVMAMVGAVSAYRQRRWDAGLPAGWAVSAAVALGLHQPVWQHQLLLPAIPLAWLSGYGWVGAWEQLRKQGLWMKWTGDGWMYLENVGLRAAIVAAGVYVAMGVEALPEDGLWKVRPKQTAVVEMLKADDTGDRWVVTDDPIYAVWAGLLSVPETGVLSAKRWMTDPEIEEMLRRLIERNRPGRVLVMRHECSPEFLAWLERDYELRWSEAKRRYYVRR